mgnify:CR=1 FL=1
MKVLLVGVGGVGEAIAVMAAKKPWLWMSASFQPQTGI